MIIYKCTNTKCRALIRHNICGMCNSRAEAVPDLQLHEIGLDAYASLQVDGRGRPYLLIKKPSGQERVSLTSRDMLR